MKRYLAVLAVMLALVSTAFGCGGFWDPCPPPAPDCPTGTCGYNEITQSNVADAFSGKANDCTWCSNDPGNLNVEQTQTNCVAVLGEDNTVAQTNMAKAEGTAQKQTQDNIAMVVGSANWVSQSNDALATGLRDGCIDCGPYGIHETQTQKNLLLAIGVDNAASQSNVAKAYSDSSIRFAYPIEQTQKNVGLLLGKKNRLTQTNDADSTMYKDIGVDPKITQIQKNIAFALNNCDDCKVDTSYIGTTSVTWPTVSVTAPAIPTIACPSGDC
ncbi:MAG: hypothetical protein QUS09_06315 [Methanotrichaceae archaeon]|nr:hypothetical protein [Methanotrichaceae archaeon]